MIQGTLSKLIEDCCIEFKYFATIPYRFKQTDLRQVSSDNKGLRRTIRDFYQYPIRTWFFNEVHTDPCLLYTSPSPRDRQKSRMPSSA